MTNTRSTETSHESQPDELDAALVRRRLERAGSPPAECCAVYREIGRRLFEALRPVRLQPARILDCSAAAANLRGMLAERYRKAGIVSVDEACRPLMPLREAAGRWPWSAQTPIVAADHATLPLASTSFEIVTSNLSLHRRLRPDTVLAEALRVLSPGGVLVLSTFGPDTLAELRECWGDIDGAEHVHPFADMHDLGDALMRVGFHDVVMHSERLVCHYPDLATVHADLRRLGVANASQQRPRCLRTPRQLARVDAAYERRRVDEGLPVTLEVVYAHAWRPAARETSVPVSFG